MTYFMTEEQELIRNVARQFAQEEVEPLANEMDKTEECPVGLIKRAADLNFFGLSIAEARGKIEACRGMVYNAARLCDEDRWNPMMASLTKAFVSETALQVANTCLQMWGCHGIANATGINRYLRDARTQCIAEGSTEIHLAQVANMLFA